MISSRSTELRVRFVQEYSFEYHTKEKAKVLVVIKEITGLMLNEVCQHIRSNGTVTFTDNGILLTEVYVTDIDKQLQNLHDNYSKDFIHLRQQNIRVVGYMLA